MLSAGVLQATSGALLAVVNHMDTTNHDLDLHGNRSVWLNAIRLNHEKVTDGRAQLPVENLPARVGASRNAWHFEGHGALNARLEQR